ncbi:MAG: hypothetical protein ISR50_04550 [Alphaproteobacteria bacterium]|nr:hypothetical protein [Alphaproteobacteria bacterium]MBL6951876.1 hypothetical protein [Alphaproteobacteria bacterium]
MRPANGLRTIVAQLALGLIEGIMTLMGLIVLVFPLALWSVPQQGIHANTIFYIVMSLGGGAIIVLIGLAYVKGLLFPDRSPPGTAAGGKARMEAYLTWSESQADARKVETQLRSMKGGALHNFAYMSRIVALLGTVVVSIYLGAWASMDFIYGSTEVLSAEARWLLLHPDSWNWK